MASGQQSGSLKDVLSGQAAFTLDFFKKVLDEQPKEKPQNLAVSPVSITLALSLVAGGAKGETLSQIVSTLKLPKDDIHAKVAELQKSLLSDTSANGGPTINFANRCYFDTSGKVKPEYTSLAEKQYGAPPGAVPFEKAPEDARKEINMWVSERTSAKVKELLPVGSVEHATRVIVANALYFKGAWATKFDPAQTKDGDFHLLDGSATPVPLMHAAKAHFGYAAHPGLKVLRLPYAAGGSSERQLAMYVLLPEDVKGLTALEKGLAAEQLQSHLSSVKDTELASVALPRFQVAAQVNAKHALKGLGLTAPFSDKAEFPDLIAPESAGGQLYLYNVFHQAVVEVNEEGTEAAAATAATIIARSFTPPVVFEATHPFLFLLRDDATGGILFIGRVTNPASRQ